jgi:hypothetical protein
LESRKQSGDPENVERRSLSNVTAGLMENRAPVKQHYRRLLGRAGLIVGGIGGFDQDIEELKGNLLIERLAIYQLGHPRIQ